MPEPAGRSERQILKPLFVAVAAVIIASMLSQLGSGGEPGWVFLRVLAAMGLMILLLREGVPVGVALPVGTIFLGVAFDVPILRIAHAFVFDAFNRTEPMLHNEGMSAIRVALMVLLINFLGQLLIAAGSVRKLVGAIERFTGDMRCALAAVPAMIGLLPMPGGAILSAPMVAEIGDQLNLNPTQKTLANYWFRHVWEWWWPMFPAVLIVIEGRYATMKEILIYMGPFSPAAMIIGWFFIVRPIKRSALPPAIGRKSRDAMDIFEVIWPVLLVGAAAIAVRVPQSHVAISQTMKDWTLPIALVLVDIALLFILPLSRRLALEATRKAVHWQMILLVFGVFALRGAFQISGADRALTEGLNTCNIPSYAVAFAAPLAISIVCGYNMAGVSMAFPLLQGIFLETGPAGVAVAYAGSFLGILASPVHLCLVLSREYYHANWGRIYRGLLPLILCMLALTLITALVG